jgi:hypothetical protein
LEGTAGLFPDVNPVAWPELSQFDRLLATQEVGDEH